MSRGSLLVNYGRRIRRANIPIDYPIIDMIWQFASPSAEFDANEGSICALSVVRQDDGGVFVQQNGKGPLDSTCLHRLSPMHLWRTPFGASHAIAIRVSLFPPAPLSLQSTHCCSIGPDVIQQPRTLKLPGTMNAVASIPVMEEMFSTAAPRVVSLFYHSRGLRRARSRHRRGQAYHNTYNSTPFRGARVSYPAIRVVSFPTWPAALASRFAPHSCLVPLVSASSHAVVTYIYPEPPYWPTHTRTGTVPTARGSPTDVVGCVLHIFAVQLCIERGSYNTGYL
ncbi:hypothetical protein N656DRAFT_484476 [Canariomyces notabilis]|uniref:Uncharacterized protein n=1 Tax=Canariomyces notabilis TaxID=2074819 RepID=A0AAN6TIQ2_9PEZI|nr:hypothetical protein N656DRAFT_484476 [Canariomyces arenarius]